MAQACSVSRGLGTAVLAAAAGATCLAGCGSNSRRTHDAPPPSPPTAAESVSYDFGTLVPAPFGTSFKDIPVPLTEVLVFHEDSDSRATEDKDCFRPKLSISFLGQPPTHHLLCFDHDRLRRVEAAVELPAAQVPALFAAACAEWQGRAKTEVLESDACTGRRGDIDFSARRTLLPETSAATVSITLTGIYGP